jgi:hypothetical protein
MTEGYRGLEPDMRFDSIGSTRFSKPFPLPEGVSCGVHRDRLMSRHRISMSGDG